MANADRLKPVKGQVNREVEGQVNGEVKGQVKRCALKSVQDASTACDIDVSDSGVEDCGSAIVVRRVGFADSPEKMGTPASPPRLAFSGRSLNTTRRSRRRPLPRGTDDMELPSNVLVLGASTERKLRSLAAALLFAAFAAYFLYDGFVGYPRKNLAALHDTLNPRPASPPPMSKYVHPKLVDVHVPGATLASLEAHLGSAGWASGGEMRWFGPAGSLHAEVEGGLVRRIEWNYGPFKDVYLQRWIGFALVAVMSGCIVLFVRVLLTRAVVDAGGLSIRGHRHIAYDEILSILTDQWPTDGTIDLEVRHLGRRGLHVSGTTSASGNVDLEVRPHGKPFLLRLDSYTYAGLPALVEYVCGRKGWPLPTNMGAADSSLPAPQDRPSMPTG